MELLKLANLCEYSNAFWPTKLKCGATCVPSNGFHGAETSNGSFISTPSYNRKEANHVEP